MSESPSRDRLIESILEFFTDQDLLGVSDIRCELESVIDTAGRDALVTLQNQLSEDNGWGYYPRNLLAQNIHNRLSNRFLLNDSSLIGSHYLKHIRKAPVILVSNHLSYADANVIEVLLRRFDDTEVANRLTALAGPKVFTSRARRFSSLCFGTIKVPQSAEVSSEEAVMNAREVARAARYSIASAHDRLSAGDALLLFAEGTRSRSGAMQPMLPGVARYLSVPEAWILPVGLIGSEKLYSVNGSSLRPAHVEMRIGSPIHTDRLLVKTDKDHSLMVHAVGLAVAELLPEEYRGVYQDKGDFICSLQALRESQ